MALSAARTVLGEDSEVRDIRFEDLLLLTDQTPVAAVASVEGPGVVEFSVETDHEGERSRRAVAILKAAASEQELPQHDVAALLAAHPSEVDGSELRQWFDSRGVQLGPAFAGLATARTAESEATTLLAEIALPGSVRSQQSAYGVHPSLLDACFQSVVAHPAAKDVGDGGLLLPLGVERLRLCGPARNARFCLVRVTTADRTRIQADLDVMDERGTVLLVVRGLRMGSRAGERSERERVLAERLLTVNWQQKALPELPDTDAGDWLLVASDTADPLASRLADVLKTHGGQCESRSMAARRRLRWCPAARRRCPRARRDLPGTTRRRRRGRTDPGPRACAPARADRAAASRPAGRAAAAVCRDQMRAGGPADRPAQPRACGTARAAARDRRRTPAAAGLPDRCVRRLRSRACGVGAAVRLRRRRDRVAPGPVVHGPAIRHSAAPAGTPNPNCRSRKRRHAPRDSHSRRLGDDSNSSLSTAGRRGREKSRSPSARPASTSPTFSLHWVGNPLSTAAQRNWESTSKAWLPRSGPRSRR